MLYRMLATMLYRLLPISLVLLVASCSKINIQDSEWCIDLGPQGAACATTLSGQKRLLDKPTWDALRQPTETGPGYVCGTLEAFTGFKTDLEELCHLTKDCVYQSQLEAFSNFIDKNKH